MKDIILIGGSTSKESRIAQRSRYKLPPIGILSLSAVLKIHGYSVGVCDLFFEDFSRKQFIEYLRSLSSNPLMVGITVYTENEAECLEIASLVKRAFSETKVVLGGPHASFYASELIKNPNIDFIVKGEGESKIASLLEHIKNPTGFPANNIAGVTSKVDVKGEKEAKTMESLSMITNLDILPFPDFTEWKFSSEYLSRMLSMVTSRGCPSKCIFCASKALSGSKYRFNSSEWVFSMVYYYYKKYKFGKIAFFDDTLLANKARAKRFCNYLISLSNEVLFSWSCKSRVDMIDEELLIMLKKAGCNSIHFGIESASQRILDTIGKKVTLEDIYTALQLTKKHDIQAECSFIIGLPNETLETIEETIILADVIEKEGFGSAVLGVTTPFPGTEIMEENEKYGLKIKVKDMQKYDLSTPICEIDGVTLNDLRKAYFYYSHQRHKTNYPKLSGRSLSEVEEIRECYIDSLKGGLAESV
ncbi:B12-binding domain-containing radical SAM protein [Alkaliphilus pronyensis]|uniref:B12-binding domain-containing radical SAM protein n=1 Tax=Alkaliphilus pronyensis TaxID=1482732 RepID=A0A6I0F7S8_9FIRM|nr:radical SAM protein [Alkaliphilus pronyensis]KAB3533482.1 B12-binding domain-containing radical SAM protein [Alkaliphilus pronyensis]